MSSPDGFYSLLETLESALRNAGYRDAANLVRRAATGPLDPDELDDAAAVSESVEPSERHMNEVVEESDHDMLTDPSASQRLSAAVKVVDLLVLEPLLLEQALQRRTSRLGIDTDEIRVRLDDSLAVSAPKRPDDDAVRAVRAWSDVLRDLREVIASADSDHRGA